MKLLPSRSCFQESAVVGPSEGVSRGGRDETEGREDRACRRGCCLDWALTRLHERRPLCGPTACGPSLSGGGTKRLRVPEDCAAPGSCGAPARAVVADRCTPKTDQRNGAQGGRTRSLVVSVADDKELRRHRRWRRLRRSALSPSWGRPHPEIGPARLARWCQAPPAPQSCCTASLFTSLHYRHGTDHSRMCGSEFGRTRAGAELGQRPSPAPALRPGQAFTGSFLFDVSVTGLPSSVITRFSSIALALPPLLTVILRGLAFSATGITS